MTKHTSKRIPYKAIRTQLGEAEDKLRTAIRLMRDNGLPENADELVRTLKHLRVWTQRHGWLDALEKAGDEPWQVANVDKSA